MQDNILKSPKPRPWYDVLYGYMRKCNSASPSPSPSNNFKNGNKFIRKNSSDKKYFKNTEREACLFKRLYILQ
jgi:hypothetical protein